MAQRVDNRADVREFLMSRRARISPAAAGVIGGGNRRVPGLRRSEVAALAGVSVEYYAKLERGAIGGASASVLDAVATEPDGWLVFHAMPVTRKVLVEVGLRR